MTQKPREDAGLPLLSTAEEELLQECSEVLDELSGPNFSYSERVIAFALRAALASVLNSLVEMETWTPEQAAGFIEGLRQDVLDPETD